MSLMTWSEEYSVGVARFDTQHKKLIDLVNKLNDAMRVGKGKDVLAAILQELLDYTVYHFKSEEEAMQKVAFDGYDEHKREHDKLTRQVLDFAAKFNSGNSMLTVSLMQFLKDWVLNHIKGTDQKYTKYLN